MPNVGAQPDTTPRPPDQAERFRRFKALHERPGIFVIPNPWDAGSARILAGLGFEALATTSAGLAFSVGKLDSAGGLEPTTGLTRQEVLRNAADIVAATDLPVSADLEGGYGEAPDACAAVIAEAIDAGLVGGSIEDASGDQDDPIYGFEHAVDRVRAAVEAARGKPFLLTARCENYLYGRPDLADTIRRLQAFEEAGADVLFAPGPTVLDDIATICAAVSRPVNVLMGIRQPTFSLGELESAGVKRVSVGGGFARVAITALVDAAMEVRDRGTFSYSAKVVSNADAARMTSPLSVPGKN